LMRVICWLGGCTLSVMILTKILRYDYICIFDLFCVM
jgi:hypothetical protein